MTEFVVVDDKAWENVKPIRKQTNPLLEALLDGKSVFIKEEDGNKLSGYYTAAARKNKKLTTRKTEIDGQVGFLAKFYEEEK